MARGKKTSLTIHLTAQEREMLTAWQRSTTISAGRARRGRMILLLADGLSLVQIAAMVRATRRGVYKWAQRFLQYGLEGLADKPGRGRRPLSRHHEKDHQSTATDVNFFQAFAMVINTFSDSIAAWILAKSAAKASRERLTESVSLCIPGSRQPSVSAGVFPG